MLGNNERVPEGGDDILAATFNVDSEAQHNLAFASSTSRSMLYFSPKCKNAETTESVTFL